MREAGRRRSRANQSWISATRASVSSICGVGVFGAIRLCHAIIMPLFMPRSSALWTVIVSLSGALPAARADELPCPTQVAPAGPAPAARAPLPAPAPRAGNIEVSSDQALLGVAGNATLEGNVVVREGEREIRADQIEYDSRDTSLRTTGSIDYRDPLVHVAGAGGSYSAMAGAEFRSARFELRQRAARGTAGAPRPTPPGLLRPRALRLTTLPADDTSGHLKAAR